MKPALIFVFLLTFALSSYSQIRLFPERTNEDDPEDMYDLPRNATYIEDAVTLNYDRLFPLGSIVALEVKGGVIIQDPVMVLADVGFALGGPKHFAEIAAGTIVSTESAAPAYMFDLGLIDELDEDAYFTLRAGYRFQSPGGLLIKLSAMGSPGNFLFPLIGVGYAF